MSEAPGDAVPTDLEALQLHLRSILASVPDGMIVINESGKILAFSSAAEKLFGYAASDVIGKDVSFLMGGHDHANHQNYVRAYLETGKRHIIGVGRVVTARRSDGAMFPVDLKIGEAHVGEHFLFTAFVRDLSEQRRNELRMQEMQAELVHFSRMSAVGTMASALAHELNQPLTAVANYLEAARDLLESDSESAREILHEALDEASRQAVRAGEIVRKLRGYVSRGEIDARSVPLLPLLADSVALARISGDVADIPIEQEILPGLGAVLADPIQVQQVVINLLRNGAEAMKGIDAPKMRLSAKPGPEDFVTVEICDKGPGMSDEVRRTLFKPFMTSKSQGMGLGLSICQTIIEAHGGKIEAIAPEAGGSCFRFTLRRDPASSSI
ncbi:MAG TPA: PAS domain S-box protein [Hyphomonas sp.]|nr:PAS domain S-box protein [Hyphomonas sp.]HRX73291.1 PAS domain S-box protein [Hyphomonas sp.]